MLDDGEVVRGQDANVMEERGEISDACAGAPFKERVARLEAQIRVE